MPHDYLICDIRPLILLNVASKSPTREEENVELLSLETPIGDEENGHLSDFIEGQGPLENWISVSHVARQGSSYDALASPVRSARSA